MKMEMKKKEDGLLHTSSVISPDPSASTSARAHCLHNLPPMFPSTSSLRAVSLLRLSALFLLGCLLSSAALAEEVLRITPQNTVLLDASGGAGAMLQYQLLRGFADEAAAEPYAPSAKIDRAAAPGFPLLVDKPGVAIPEGRNVIALGAGRFLQPEERAQLEQNPGAILLRRRGPVLIVAGQPYQGQGGTVTAATEFLNRAMGIRFYAPPEPWHSRPAGGAAEVGPLDLFRKQVFVTSMFAPYWKANDEWLRMNQNGNRMTLQCFHALANVVPPEKYGVTHPEIYELRGGERRVPLSIGTRIWNPCLSAKALPELTMEYIREQKRTRPALTYVPLGMMDITFDCGCADCQASVKATGSYSNLYFSYVNEVAKRCRLEFPGLYLTCFSYVNAKVAPVGVQFEPNVAVKIVIKSYMMRDPAYREAIQKNILAFSDAGAGWFFHDWRFSGVTPRNDLPDVAEFLRWAAEHKCLGAYYEYSPEQNFYLDGAYYWILMRLTSDPYLDVDALWKQYCGDMFGRGAGKMLAFYKHFETRQKKAIEVLRILGDMPRQECVLYGPEDVAWQRKTLEEAMALTRDEPLVQQRLGDVMRHFRAHELFALATHKPFMLNQAPAASGINQPLLAYYLNDDGRGIAEAIRYYQEERNLPPATGELEMRLGYLPTVIANHSNGIDTLLKSIQQSAQAAIGDSLSGQARVTALREKSVALLHANLAASPRPERVRFFERLLDKTVYVPRVASLPKLDGVLDDDAWKSAADLDGFSIRSSILPSRHVTRGKLLRVGDRLVVGLTCQQEGPIWAQTPRETLTGTHIWRESGVEISFGSADSETPRKAFAQYDVNALGAFRGFFAAADHRQDVEVAVKLDEAAKQYVIEAVLPLKTDQYDFTQAATLSFNVVRMIYTRDSYGADELLNWHPTSNGTLIFGP